MSTPLRFRGSEYKNWLKCHLSLCLMKEGLHSFIDTETRNLHSDTEQKVSSVPHGPSVGTQCGLCTWRNIKLTHRHPRTWSINCKKNICNHWLSQILSVHNDPHNPSICWKNSDISQWPTDPYAVAKVYMPKGQDRINNLPQELDAFAVLSLLKYCTWFSRNVPNTQILSDLIDVRNKLMHSGDLRVSDVNKDAWIDLMTQLMSDLNINSAVRAELQKTKVEDMDINFRETEVQILRRFISGLAGDLDNVKADIGSLQSQFHDLDSVKTNMDILQTAQSKLQSDVDKDHASMAALQVAQTQQGQELQKVKDHTTEAAGKVATMETDMTRIKTEVQKLTEISQKIASFLANNPDIIDKDISANNERIEKAVLELQNKQCEVEKEMSDIKTALSSIKTEIRGMKRKFSEIEERMEKVHCIQEEDVENLRNDLLSRYKSFRTIPISPTDDKEGVLFDYFYTDIAVNCEDTEKTNASSYKGGQMENEEKQEEMLKSYKQLFGRKNERIILTGLSGSGKSVFCRKIVNTWYKVHDRKKSNACTNKAESSTHDCTDEFANEKVLLRFDLLFYINASAIRNETKLVEVLYNQCLKKDESEQETTCERILKILSDQPEKILIIFDGLDEMGHTPYFLSDICKREMYSRVTVLMAMRQWRISRLDLRPLSDYCDLLLDVQGFSEKNAMRFVQKVLDLNKHGYKQAEQQNLSKKDTQVLALFRTVPRLLLFLANIWCRDKSLPEKCTDLYRHVLDLLIERCLTKTGSKYTESFSDQANMWCYVKMFRETYVDCACKAAYHFLLHEKGASSVVIPEKKLMEELGDNDQLKLSALLDCGIISKADSLSPMEKNVSVTFLNRSIQEYMASIYLVENENEFQNFLTSLKTLKDVLRYCNCLIFICGMDVSRGQRAYSRICQVCDEDPLVLQYRQCGDDYEQGIPIMNLNAIHETCLNEIGNNVTLDISDIFPWVDKDIFSRLGKSSVRSLNLQNVMLFDFLPDLSLLTNLNFLTLRNLHMTSKNGQALCIGISSCVHLKKLFVSDIGLNDNGLFDGVIDLSRLTNLTCLTLKNVRLSEKCVRSLCSKMTGCIQLKQLELNGIRPYSCMQIGLAGEVYQIGAGEFNRCLCGIINGCTHLEKLFLDNIILTEGVLHFNNLNYLTSLTMSSISTSEECGTSLCCSISSCTHLEKLELQHMILYEGVSQWSKLTNLSSLRLIYVKMFEESSSSLCSSIGACTLLKQLCLKNIILHKGVLDLSSLSCLTSLKLSSIIISDECNDSLCNSISDCIHLEKLVMRDIKLYCGTLDLRNLINLTSLKIHKVAMSRFFSGSISGCTHLEKLELSGSLILPLDKQQFPIRTPNRTVFFEQPELMNLHGELDLSSMTNLKSLLLCNVTMSEECTRSLCRSIGACTLLKSLELKRITLHKGLLDISGMNNLTSLALSKVTISEECCIRVCSSISRCIHLKKLRLENMGKLDDALDLRNHLYLHYLDIYGCTYSSKIFR